MTTIFPFPSKMENNSFGFNVLAQLCEITKNLYFEDLILDFTNTTWFEANLSAPLGTVLNHISENLNSIHFQGMSLPIQNILRKNEFLTYYGHGIKIDNYGTVIRYAPFAPKDYILFNDYLDQQLFSKHSLPQMTAGLIKEIKRSINEVFGNASTHGKANRIFACGQYFPNKKRMDFTIANLGTSFHENVYNYLKTPISPENAIDWATQKGNTTRIGPIPGGLGLYTLLSFLQLNKGKLQIVSGSGYWLFNENGVYKSPISHWYQGAIINIEFNINDPNTYALSTELDQQNIF